MAREIRSFDVTTPAGTLKATPLITNVGMPPRVVDSIAIRIPPGPSGLLGFAIAAAGQPIIPFNAGAFIVGDDEVIDWAVSGYITSGAWQVITYNLGDYSHTLEIRFSLSLVSEGVVVAPPAVDMIDLSNLPPQTAAQTDAAQLSLDELAAQLAAVGASG